MKEHYLKRVRHPRDVFFTQSEIRDKKYTVADAVAAAKVVLDGKRKPRQPVVQVNLSILHGRNLNEAITMLELNRIQDQLVTESEYSAGDVSA